MKRYSIGVSILLLSMIFLIPLSIGTITYSDQEYWDIDDLPLIIIDEVPFNITEPGYYVLDSDFMQESSEPVIYVDACSDSWEDTVTGPVVIDGDGHSITYAWDPDGDTHTIEVICVTGLLVMDLEINDPVVGIYYTSYSLDETDEAEAPYTNIDNIIMFRNIVINNPVDIGIYLDEKEFPAVLDNIVVQSDDAQTNASGVYISNNVFDDDYNTMITNSVFRNLYVGIDTYWTYQVTVLNTTLTGNYIGVWADSDENFFIGSSVIDGGNRSNSTGVLVESSNDFMIANTMVKNNLVGLDIYNTYRASVVESMVVNNSQVNINATYSDLEIYRSFMGGSSTGISLFVPEDASNMEEMYFFIHDTAIAGNDLGFEAYGVPDDDEVLYLGIENTTFINDMNIDMTGLKEEALDDRSFLFSNYYSDATENADTYSVELTGGGELTDHTVRHQVKPQATIEDVDALYYTDTHELVVNITMKNLLNANGDVAIEIGYMMPLTVTEMDEGMWIPLSFEDATTVNDGDVVTVSGNYYIPDEDDAHAIYMPDFPINIYGIDYEAISFSTNGYIELVAEADQAEISDMLLKSDYDTHTILYSDLLFDSLYQQYYVTPYETVVYGYDSDLTTDLGEEEYGVGVFDQGDNVTVMFKGSTYKEESPEYPVEYQITFYRNGTIMVNIGNIRVSGLDGYSNAFTGISLLKPFYTEPTGTYQSPPNKTYIINGLSITHLNTSQANIAGNQEKTISITLDNIDLPNNTLLAVKISPATQETGKAETLYYIPVTRTQAGGEQEGGEQGQAEPQKLSPEQRRVFEDITRFFQQNPINNTQALEENKDNIIMLAEKMFQKGLSKTPPPLSNEAKENLRKTLESLYGPLLQDYPDPHGRLYLLYWLYT